jgi:hypothetical protein
MKYFIFCYLWSLCYLSVQCMLHFVSSSLNIITYKAEIILSLLCHLAQSFRHHHLSIQVHCWKPPATKFTNLLPYYVHDPSYISLLFIFYISYISFCIRKSGSWILYFPYVSWGEYVFLFSHKPVCTRKEWGWK